MSARMRPTLRDRRGDGSRECWTLKPCAIAPETLQAFNSFRPVVTRSLKLNEQDATGNAQNTPVLSMAPLTL